MNRFVSLSAFLTAFALAPAALAEDHPAAEKAEAVKAVDAADDAKPVKLVSFDGERQFLKASSRLRVWRPTVGYTLTVDADGNATDCTLTEKFRSTYVNIKLCEVLMDHHQFEPARNAADAPVEGSYTSRLVYLDLRNK